MATMRSNRQAMRSLQDVAMLPFERALLRQRLGRNPSAVCTRREMSNLSNRAPHTIRTSPFRSTIFTIHRQCRHNSTQTPGKAPSPNVTAQLGSPQAKLSLYQRFKKMSKQYGWVAVGVYLGLSALDLPISFLIVRLAGPERIGHYEHVIWSFIKEKIVSPLGISFGSSDSTKEDGQVVKQQTELQKAETANNGGATIWTQLALAYAIHKSLFIFVRIPVTVAITPSVAKVLQRWGWNVGKKVSGA